MLDKETVIKIIDEEISDDIVLKNEVPKNWTPIFLNIIKRLNLKKENNIIKPKPSFDELTEKLKTKSYSFIELNNNYKEMLVHNVTRINIHNFYPTLMVNNKEKWKSEVDCPEIFDVIQICLENKDKYKNTSIYVKIKMFYNSVYGYLVSHKSNIINMRNNLISEEGRIIISELYNNFHRCFYADTDELFFNKYESDKDRVESILKEKNLKFSTDVIEGSCLFMRKKKYILGIKDVSETKNIIRVL